MTESFWSPFPSKIDQYRRRIEARSFVFIVSLLRKSVCPQSAVVLRLIRISACIAPAISPLRSLSFVDPRNEARRPFHGRTTSDFHRCGGCLTINIETSAVGVRTPAWDVNGGYTIKGPPSWGFTSRNILFYLSVEQMGYTSSMHSLVSYTERFKSSVIY